MLTKQQIIHLVDYNYGVMCRYCGTKVADPDKNPNQIYLTARCPKCSKSFLEEQMASIHVKRRQSSRK